VENLTDAEARALITQTTRTIATAERLVAESKVLVRKAKRIIKNGKTAAAVVRRKSRS